MNRHRVVMMQTISGLPVDWRERSTGAYHFFVK